jgi:hypothetical protein
MNRLRFLLAFLVVLGSDGLSSGQDQQQPGQQSQAQQSQSGSTYQPSHASTTREWTGLIPGYQQPAGVETQYGVMTQVRASQNLRPSGAQFLTQASVNADRSKASSSGAVHAPQRNPSKQVVRKIPESGQNGVKPMVGEKVVSRDAPRSFNEYGAQLFSTLLPKPEPHDLIMRCGVQGRSADVVTGRCM